MKKIKVRACKGRKVYNPHTTKPFGYSKFETVNVTPFITRRIHQKDLEEDVKTIASKNTKEV